MAASNIRYLKIGIVVVAWVGVLLAAAHRSHPPVVLGRYSWNYASLLGLLVGIAVMVSLTKLAWYEKLYQARAGIILSAVSLLLSLGAVELGIRIFDPLGISYYEQSGEYQRDKLADEHLIFRHRPLWETRYGDVMVTYNEQGLRDRPILPKAKEEFRILALGDSVTFGWGVQQDKIFASRLEQLLPGRLQRPVRVINSGVGGYNTVQEVTYFKREGITLQPDLVLLTYIGNDIEENRGPFNPWAGPTSIKDLVMKMLGKFWSYRLVQHTYRYAVLRQVKAQSSNPLRDGEGWRQSMSSLDELVVLCKEQHIPLIVFFRRSHPDENRPLFADVVRHVEGFPVKDMGPWYQGLDESSLVLSKVDGHPNAEGHRVMAEHMADDIVDYLQTSP
ncbi:MAG: SGNH/GDSL hydrolase family protein [Nitrospira sp.]|nr:SGNH/GDSL hydrolase family protein [Nitrospira sp.]